jgi:hypothetical protein
LQKPEISDPYLAPEQAHHDERPSTCTGSPSEGGCRSPDDAGVHETEGLTSISSADLGCR